METFPADFEVESFDQILELRAKMKEGEKLPEHVLTACYKYMREQRKTAASRPVPAAAPKEKKPKVTVNVEDFF